MVRENHHYRGVEAVVDKDRASALLAIRLDVDTFVITTDVEAVYRNCGSADEQKLRTLPATKAKQWLSDGAFPAGSMGPKVESAARFAEQTGREARIGALDELEALLAGEAGTLIPPDGSLVLWDD